MPSHPRLIPSIEKLRQRPEVRRLETRYGREATVRALRDEAAALRRRLAGGAAEVRGAEEAAQRIEAALAARIAAALAPSLRPVVNATGVIVHTNLGRAPLGRTAVERVAALAAGYTNLEYDLSTGRRGSRAAHASTLVRRLTGAEAAVVVNNNAAAVLLTLAALAAGREVLISRGELVEIGGGFRVPDVLRQSGAILREVGTTNRTRAADYAAAAGESTALLLRVHPSNFRIEGFTERPPLAEVAGLGERLGVPVVEDLGSGCPRVIDGIEDEPTVGESIAAGVAVCTFSGDKLLGGPQAGVIAGRRAAHRLPDRRRHRHVRRLPQPLRPGRRPGVAHRRPAQRPSGAPRAAVGERHRRTVQSRRRPLDRAERPRPRRRLRPGGRAGLGGAVRERGRRRPARRAGDPGVHRRGARAGGRGGAAGLTTAGSRGTMSTARAVAWASSS